ncbi:MAG: hypothetical protein K2P17_04375 [Helicobacteraceae bacterium]|nr:hypothetical protein [Helicobacteraceae bacterium]
MSIKNNLDYIKSEFSNDEKLIKNAFKLEILYKRYKKIIFLIGGIIVACIVFFGIKFYYTEHNAVKYSRILVQLSENPNDEALRNDLKNGNEKLYRLFILQQALNTSNIAQLEELSSGNNSDFVDYIASYHLGSFERNATMLKKIDKYNLSDLAKLQEAYLLINKNKITDAKNILNKIPQDSSLSESAKMLLHYTILKDDK